MIIEYTISLFHRGYFAVHSTHFSEIPSRQEAEEHLSLIHIFLRKRIYLFGWLSHYSAAVSSLVWVVGMTVIMGLIRQAPSGHASNDMLGFSQMISSWPFVLLYFWMVTALGLTILRAGFPFRIGRLSFLLNHTGLFVALITATLGNADMQRLKMTTRMGNAEWRATRCV